MFFFLALILYITSCVGSIILFIVSKNLPAFIIKFLFLFHAIFIILAIAHLYFKSTESHLPFIFPISFLLSCCSGMLIFGIIINLPHKTFLKAYFSLFILSVPFFILKPSGLINFLLYTEIRNNKNDSFVIEGNLILEKQQTSLNKDFNNSSYKIITRHGLFTKTIKRDILFRSSLDSIKIIYNLSPDSLSLRGYSFSQTNRIDSADKVIYLIQN